MGAKNYWVYILLCENNSYYTGYTHDLPKRYLSHVNGTGKCKYTRSFKPIKIAQSWQIQGDKALAMRLERYIKTLSRTEKESLIACPSELVLFSTQLHENTLLI
jgi:putative endonuclease